MHSLLRIHLLTLLYHSSFQLFQLCGLKERGWFRVTSGRAYTAPFMQAATCVPATHTNRTVHVCLPALCACKWCCMRVLACRFYGPVLNGPRLGIGAPSHISFPKAISLNVIFFRKCVTLIPIIVMLIVIIAAEIQHPWILVRARLP